MKPWLVDNSLSPRFAEAIRAAGHEARHVRDMGLASADDATIFERARNDGMTIIAQDTDFGTILAMSQSTKPSVILFRCQLKSTDALVKLLMSNLANIQTDIEAGAIVVIEDTRIRMRRLPVSGSAS